MLFEKQIKRKPNLYPWTQDFILAFQKGFWTAEEFSFSSDIQDFKTVLSEEERQLITKSLSAIGQIEIDVKTFWGKIGDNLPHPSISDLGYSFAYSEVVHNNAYEKLLTVLNMDDIFETNLLVPAIANRVNYLKAHCKIYSENEKQQFLYSLILFTLFIENVSLFAQFLIIGWFGRYKNALKDTVQQTDYTRSEETLHFKAGAKIINTIKEEYPELWNSELISTIQKEGQKAFKYECQLIDWVIGDYSGERFSADIVKEYIKYKFNEGFESIGIPLMFQIDKNKYRDFEWMIEESNANIHTDFFFKRSTGYIKKSSSFEEEDLF